MPNWLAVDAPSLPRLLQQAGYRTAHYGKWHLGGGGGINGHPNAPFVKEYGYDDTRTWNGNGPTWYETTPWPFTLRNDPDEVGRRTPADWRWTRPSNSSSRIDRSHSS